MLEKIKICKVLGLKCAILRLKIQQRNTLFLHVVFSHCCGFREISRSLDRVLILRVKKLNERSVNASDRGDKGRGWAHTGLLLYSSINHAV